MSVSESKLKICLYFKIYRNSCIFCSTCLQYMTSIRSGFAKQILKSQRWHKTTPFRQNIMSLLYFLCAYIIDPSFLLLMIQLSYIDLWSYGIRAKEYNDQDLGKSELQNNTALSFLVFSLLLNFISSFLYQTLVKMTYFGRELVTINQDWQKKSKLSLQFNYIQNSEVLASTFKFF